MQLYIQAVAETQPVIVAVEMFAKIDQKSWSELSPLIKAFNYNQGTKDPQGYSDCQSCLQITLQKARGV